MFTSLRRSPFRVYQLNSQSRKFSSSSTSSRYVFPTALGVAAIGFVQARRHVKEQFPDFSFSATFLGPFIPYNALSRTVGALAQVDLRYEWVKSLAYNGWSKMYNCNLDEMLMPLSSYKTMSEFFMRSLKPGSRIIDSSKGGVVVSPVDAVVLHQGSVGPAEFATLQVEQVKGVTYSAAEFLGPDPQGLKSDKPVNYVVLYLAPGDYHHFHSPVDWKILQRRHFAGSLIPVRPWAVRKYPGLYSRNERVILNGTWGDGYYFGFGAVGALNVGSIQIDIDPTVVTNEKSVKYRMSERNFASEIAAKRGQKLGAFNFGSTIVLIFQSSEEFKFTISSGDTVRVGQRIGVNSAARQLRTTIHAPPWPSA